MAKKMDKKTRNVLSGILVGIASLYAVINFADVSAIEVRNFIFSTALFILGIVLLALLAVSLIKLPGLLKNSLSKEKDLNPSTAGPEAEKPQANSDKEG
jgi:hypothetical protein